MAPALANQDKGNCLAIYVCVPQCHGLPASKQSRTLNAEELMRQPDIPVCHLVKHTDACTHTHRVYPLKPQAGRWVHGASTWQSAAAVIQVCRRTDGHFRLLGNFACL